MNTPVNHEEKLILTENQPVGEKFYVQGTAQIFVYTTENTGSVTVDAVNNIPSSNVIGTPVASDAEAKKVGNTGIYYNYKDQVFREYQTYTDATGKVQDVFTTVSWSEVRASNEGNHKWLGGKTIGREGGSDDVVNQREAVVYFNKLADQAKGAEFDSTAYDYFYYDEEAGGFRQITAFTATTQSPWTTGAEIILEGMAEKREGGTARTREKWVPTEITITKEGFTEVDAGKHVPYRLVVKDDTGTRLATHVMEAVLLPKFSWVKTPAW